MDQYPIPKETAISLQEIKKSRFITHLAHSPGIKAAQVFISSIRQQHQDARHHCWAYVAGAPNDSMKLGFSDDGEPSGTAGKPILAQLHGSGIGEITAVVTRYSGGIKLGTGGLVSAYGGGVKNALSQLETHQKVLQQALSLAFSYDQQNTVSYLMESFDAMVTSSDYGDMIRLNLNVPQHNAEDFAIRLEHRGQGKITIQKID